MCVITICKDRCPTDEELISWNSSNPDGIGVAWVKNNKIFFKKGLVLDQAKGLIRKIDLPFIIHFRLSSSGGKAPELTHPFIIDKQVDNNPLSGTTTSPVLFHNGTERNAVDLLVLYCLINKVKLPEKLSDSLAIAKLVAVLGEGYLNTLRSNFAILYPNGVIKTWGNWYEDNGIITTSYTNYTKANYIVRCTYQSNPASCPIRNYHKCKAVWLDCPYG